MTSHRFQRHRGGKRIAAEGRPVRARREHIHQLAGADEGGYRQHAAAQRLAQNDPVRSDALVLEGEPGAGAAKTRLHLVDDQQYAVRIAQAPQPREPACRRNDDAGLALDRLDQHGRRLAAGSRARWRRCRRMARRGNRA